eukprot:8684465-Heterocapsa_arctica.AAC.1
MSGRNDDAGGLVPELWCVLVERAVCEGGEPIAVEMTLTCARPEEFPKRAPPGGEDVAKGECGIP